MLGQGGTKGRGNQRFTIFLPLLLKALSNFCDQVPVFAHCCKEEASVLVSSPSFSFFPSSSFFVSCWVFCFGVPSDFLGLVYCVPSSFLFVYVLILRLRPFPLWLCLKYLRVVKQKMSSRLEMFDSQETSSSGSVSRNDKDDENVMDQMYEAADQMGEGMRIGLGGNFEYPGVRSDGRGEEVACAD